MFAADVGRERWHRNRDAEEAAGVSQYRSFDQLTRSVGFFRFFPQRRLGCRSTDCIASDTAFLIVLRSPASRIAAKYPGVSTLGNSDEPYWGCQIVGGVPSTGSQCATDKEYHWRRRRFRRGRPTFERRGYFGSKGSSCCQRFSGIQANLPCQSQCMYTSVQAKKRFDEKPFLTSFYARKQHPFTYFGIGPKCQRAPCCNRVRVESGLPSCAVVDTVSPYAGFQQGTDVEISFEDQDVRSSVISRRFPRWRMVCLGCLSCGRISRRPQIWHFGGRAQETKSLRAPESGQGQWS